MSFLVSFYLLCSIKNIYTNNVLNFIFKILKLYNDPIIQALLKKTQLLTTILHLRLLISASRDALKLVLFWVFGKVFLQTRLDSQTIRSTVGINHMRESPLICTMSLKLPGGEYWTTMLLSCLVNCMFWWWVFSCFTTWVCHRFLSYQECVCQRKSSLQDAEVNSECEEGWLNSP